MFPAGTKLWIFATLANLAKVCSRSANTHACRRPTNIQFSSPVVAISPLEEITLGELLALRSCDYIYTVSDYGA